MSRSPQRACPLTLANSHLVFFFGLPFGIAGTLKLLVWEIHSLNILQSGKRRRTNRDIKV